MDKMVAYIPIRLNSKRVKGKNIKILGNKPLFLWSLETLLKLDIKVYIYTNWCDELQKICDEYNVDGDIEFLTRPKYLDDDLTKGIDIYKSFAKDVPSENYLLTHCTSPFTSVETYKQLMNAVLNDGYDSAFTVCKHQTFSWYKNKPINFDLPRPRTQDMEPVYIETSAGYCYNKSVLDKNARTGDNYKMIVTEAKESTDIDEYQDFHYANIMIQNGGEK